jgi:ubiquinone/menaquinone biosynthesis C-methylase UbiE/uncharacterized protein YbaR (Trm112 family)
MEWISILQCPNTGQDLRLLTASELSAFNEKISKDQVWQADGKPFRESLKEALINADNRYVYPLVKGIVLLLKDLALTDDIHLIHEETLSGDKQLVKNFYDNRGWFADEAGNYEDAVIYEDLRGVAKDYIKKCHDRVSRFLNPTGKYMLDAASGALQYEDYLQYSDGYQYRVCVDFSFQALTEAKKKLGAKGLCILCDMTNMPFKDNVMDGFVSLNTIYHIPKEEQATAVKELYRVLAVGGKGVIVYDWFKHSPWMNFWMLPFRSVVYIKNRTLNAFGKAFGTKGAEKLLYFHAHKPDYFEKNLPPYQLKVWRSLSVHFMRYYIHSWLFGKQILAWVYNQEEKNPEKCGRKGEYPMLVFEK